VYTVTPILGPAASSGATASAAPSASPSGAASAVPSPTFAPADPDAPQRFAVGMLSVDESRIAPGDPSRLQALGGEAPGAGGPGEPRPNARDEIWIPIVLIALLVLTIEWLVYERDTLARLRRGIAARFRGSPAGRGA
jgi:hypothetical protein